MPTGVVKRIVWLSTQSARLENNDLNPSRNTIGYGIIRSDEDDQEIFFDAKAFEDMQQFNLLREGQPVEYVRDGNAPAAKSVKLMGKLVAQ